jgi:hypothetical protein
MGIFSKKELADIKAQGYKTVHEYLVALREALTKKK